jgi:serine/threonine protein kinase
MVAGYNVLEQIGEGGMATIFRARHSILERDVALKKIKKPVKESIDRFRQEAKLSARLNHENIVSIYDFIREGRSYFLVMEYINGIDFRNILEIASPVPPHEAARVIHEVAKGLEYAHFKRVIHRDIKPSNILLSQAGDVKIIDFGVAKTHDSAASDFDGDYHRYPLLLAAGVY